jgi:hypothetical protein
VQSYLHCSQLLVGLLTTVLAVLLQFGLKGSQLQSIQLLIALLLCILLLLLLP